MRTYLITGGTNGIGIGLGLRFLRRGDRVIAVASGRERGRAFLDEAARLGAADRARFLRADLSTLAGMRSVLQEVGSDVDRLDGLVLSTQRFRPKRQETTDGLEHTFALTYLNRFVLGHGLAALLELAPRPVVLNLAGSGGLPGRIQWDDLQLRHRYSGGRASMQASRCLDLLGVDFPRRHPGSAIRYVLYNPLFTRTGIADSMPGPQRMLVKALARVLAQPVEKAIGPMVALMDDPPQAPVSAWRRDKPVPLTGDAFDAEAAERLHDLTVALLPEDYSEGRV